VYTDRVTETEAGKTSDLGVAIALGWLAVTTLGFLGTVVAALDPMFGANLAILTIPAFASGWAGMLAAIPTRKRGMPTALLAPLGGIVAGFAAGLGVLWMLYVSTWPLLG
jgi:hypothetical protein